MRLFTNGSDLRAVGCRLRIWGLASQQSGVRLLPAFNPLGYPTFHSGSRNGLAGVVVQTSPNLELVFWGKFEVMPWMQ